MIGRMFDRPRGRICLTLGSFAVLGSGVLFHSSRWGVGLSPDSVVYIGGYAGREWWESQTLNRVKRVMPATVLFSNAPEVCIPY